MRKTRITLIADVNYAGGTRTYLEMLTDLLLAQDFDLRVLASFPGDDVAFLSFMADRRVPCQALPQRGKFAERPFIKQIWELCRLIPFFMRHNPDLVIVSSGTPGSWLSVFLLPVSSLLVLHTAVTAPMGLKERIVAWLPLRRLSLKRRLVTVSRYAVNELARHWRVASAFIHNATPFSDAAGRQHEHTGKVVLTVGHVVEYKNPSVWLNVAQRVLARHPDASFIWYGDGPLLETMRKQAKGLAGVVFSGRKTAMIEMYTKASVYFQPSILESHGIAVLEAMSHGLPCVVSNRGGLPESIEQGVTGFAEDADDAESMATRICALLEDSHMAATFGEAGRQRVLADFMPERWERETIQMINACLTGGAFSES